ncbi:unnamed protein product [Meloidogyne enterolobii]|uniref:Uncharacterized protein n=1 Tax=Meloidogyne enterolobii TaxID=390850 RepID=A0ACB1AT12_MELEN
MWHIPPAKNSFIYAKFKLLKATNDNFGSKYDILDVYQTKWNGSKLMKVKQASLRGNVNVPVEHFRFSSSINGGLLFKLSSYYKLFSDNSRRFGISFSRRSEDGIHHPCPQPFYFATNSPQRLPTFPLGYLQTCIFSINSTLEIKLTINSASRTSKFGLKVPTANTKNRVGLLSLDSGPYAPKYGLIRSAIQHLSFSANLLLSISLLLLFLSLMFRLISL